LRYLAEQKRKSTVTSFARKHSLQVMVQPNINISEIAHSSNNLHKWKRCYLWSCMIFLVLLFIVMIVVLLYYLVLAL